MGAGSSCQEAGGRGDTDRRGGRGTAGQGSPASIKRLERQLGRRLDLLHGQQGGDVEDLHPRNERLVEIVIGLGVPHPDLQDVIDVTRQTVCC